MTITRLQQFTAEDRVTSRLTSYTTVTQTISSTKARTGTYSYRLDSTPIAFGMVVPTPVAAYRVGYWLNHNGIGTDVKSILYMAATGKTVYESPMIMVRLNGITSNLEIVRPVSGTSDSWEVLATVTIPAALLVTNTWVHVGICHKIDATTGFLSVYINGALALSLTGDTRPYGQGSGTPSFASTASYIFSAGSWTTGSGAFSTFAYVDDFYIDSYVGEVDAPVPARRFDVMLVTGAGANAEWTPSAGANYACVDENPNTGDTDYVKALAADLKDTYAFGDVTVPTDHRIVAMIPTVFIKNLDVGPLVRLHAYDGSTYANSDDLTPALDYTIPLFARFETQPDATDWNETDANAATFGIESRGTFV